ncbi:RsmE family RNA methyltransferase [Gimesia panareensis]|uniref:Ribosomal RNA small subunit methyltransferase E n=1 Tax=Gimesia panareensis TaxID=2527978 RepID=A0A517Q0L4_9PLAN|nr:RsmE family RNA methyltransferase [Gimesia panareensis]QDT25162.1 Ribosomal RNA small subunit methyltransferase E [Gimesia panareensis]QDU48127.1 Ribosomal RNA small subunit methyltransferase E [Gimesia panareensis]
MAHRFFYEGSFDDDLLPLEGSEAHHLLHVLRLKEGDQVLLFNGTGVEVEGKIEKTGRKSVEIRVISRRESGDEKQVPLILATAVPKGDRFRWLVEKAAELGVTKLVPLITERSSVDPGENKLKKLQQTIVSAAKQSGQIRLMELAPVQQLGDFFKEIGESGVQLLIADPQGVEWSQLNQSNPNSSAAGTVILVGPEGGFSPEEVQAAQDAGAEAVKINAGILRIETAALLMAGLMRLPTS